MKKKVSTTGTVFRYGVILAVCIIILNTLYLFYHQKGLEQGQIIAPLTGLCLFILMFFAAGRKRFKSSISLFVSLLMIAFGAIVLLQALMTGMDTSRETGFLFFIILIFISYGIPRFPRKAALATALVMTTIYLISAVYIFRPVSEMDTALTTVFMKDGWLLAIVHITGLFVAKTRDAFFSREDELYSDLVSAHRKLRFSYDSVQEELQMARIIQRNVLPPEELEIDGLDIKTHYLPFREVSGDIYDISEIRPGLVRIFLADAPGHGIQAALITMIIRSEYEKLKRKEAGPAELIRELNRNFIRSYESLQNYFSCIMVDIDLVKRKITYSSAGHPEQFLICSEQLIVLPATGILAGDLFESEYVQNEYSFEERDRLLIFTDGLYERMNEEIEQSVKRVLYGTLEKSRTYRAGDLFTSLLKTLEEYHRDRKLEGRHDDITLITIERIATEKKEA